MIVQKFGGTSLESSEALSAVAARVGEAGPAARVVVASAMAGVTDVLLDASRRAEGGDRAGAIESALAVERRHLEVLAALCPGDAQAGSRVTALGRGLRVALSGLRHLGRPDARARDTVAAFGELLSTRVLEGVLGARGVPTRWVDPRQVVVTEERFGGARPLGEETLKRARAAFGAALTQGDVALIGGFVAAAPSGATTNLGRGGSDLTASLLGGLLAADRVEIWTDVDGLMSADPRIVPAARLLGEVSFAEAAALSQYGAGILHPDAVAPAVEADVPVVIRNSRRPDCAGTRIVSRSGTDGGVRALSCLRGVGLIRLRESRGSSRTRMLGDALARLEAETLTPRFLAHAEGSLALLLTEGDLGRAEAVLRPLGAVEVLEGLGVVCVVGDADRGEGSLATEVLSVLSREKVHLVASGAGRAQLAVVLGAGRVEPGLRRLHARLIEGTRAREAGGS